MLCGTRAILTLHNKLCAIREILILHHMLCATRVICDNEGITGANYNILINYWYIHGGVNEIFVLYFTWNYIISSNPQTPLTQI